MYAVQVTRHAGSAHGHHFEHAVARLKWDDGVMMFHTQADAQRMADHYAKQANGPHAICRRTYEVVPYE